MANRNRESYNAYMREYMLRRYHVRKAEAIAFLGGKCVCCERRHDLQFDHKDRATKSFTIAKLWSLSEKRFWDEIMKCQLLCQEHHNDKTILEMGFQKAKGVHGAPNSHRYCKCSVCMESWRQYQRERRRIRLSGIVGQQT